MHFNNVKNCEHPQGMRGLIPDTSILFTVSKSCFLANLTSPLSIHAPHSLVSKEEGRRRSMKDAQAEHNLNVTSQVRGHRSQGQGKRYLIRQDNIRMLLFFPSHFHHPVQCPCSSLLTQKSFFHYHHASQDALLFLAYLEGGGSRAQLK